MSSSALRAAEALKLYKFPKYDILKDEGANLPEAYKKFYREWKYAKPKPVHYIPPPNKWIRDAKTGEVKVVQDHPIPIIYPPESHLGIWGGEGVIKGFQKRNRYKQRVSHFWVPNLMKSAVYSEILDERMTVTVTERTIDLIIEHHGFDNYILQNRACDLQSHLALRLKQKMLHALYHKELYPDNVTKKDEIYNKYKHFLEDYSEEDIEWYGLTIDEALQKYEKLTMEKNKPTPLKHKFRRELIQKLMDEKDQKLEIPKDEPESWMKRFNPFSSKS